MNFVFFFFTIFTFRNMTNVFDITQKHMILSKPKKKIVYKLKIKLIRAALL